MPDCLSRLFLCLYLLSTLTLVLRAQQQVVLESTNPDIVYIPQLCNASAAETGCLSAWQTYIDIPNINGTAAVATGTMGPIPQTGNTPPQMFLTFRASALYLRTSPFSNATVNVSLTADPNGVSITRQVNTSVGLIIAENLPETQTTTLGVTFLQGPSPTRFDVESITLNVTNSSAASSSYLPTLSLPTSSFPPSLSPSSTSTAKSNASQRTGTIIGGTLGGVLGFLAILIAGTLVYWRWRRRRIRRSETGAGYAMTQVQRLTRR
ncbi:uncharacterized protein EDB91DRAFT_1143638 [Suillus paluster]|uniref:uncharacterized protein n=1 Tax=Suillus paluster TaxID=48578 RepID=UPI001B86508D|nr:uncharacterized protein EDB91DRAFT_1143638 [Suillus paluster]KAG1735938.1 hypothetical protein EDB91DRAFT_1143638 [Suillus paluster]